MILAEGHIEHLTRTFNGEKKLDLKTWVTILRSFNLFYVPKTNHWQPIIMAMPIRRVKLFDKIDLFLGWYQIFVYVHLCVESFGRNQLSFIRFHSKIIYKNAIECIAIKYFTRTPCHRTRTGRGLLYITFQNETHLHTMGNQIKMINTGIGHFIALAYQNEWIAAGPIIIIIIIAICSILFVLTAVEKKNHTSTN